ncbi:MAG: polysaccharide ABC transporter ATP-binding protein [Paludibacter sp.]|nr:polysaccharide ABC transporter ATP-binding protein [Paludibacter sp.]
MPTAIEFENISKQYRLGLVSTRTLSHDLKRWYAMNIQGKDDPYLKIGEVNDRAHRGESEYVWALKDINFKVEQGDVLGIIGKNGAGKSTLLKILSKVTTPSTGTIKARGRIASLLEVGTGFHPEMTGRENIYMNGAIMGMTKAEINRKFDEIVDFSGVERYIDTPAKRYSSGMTVRLGFAIAAHLDPEILVVDEVLAVGDAEFQKKAIGKMQDVSKGEGRTVLFVSHNMAAIDKLCKNLVVLDNGKVEYIGSVQTGISKYLNKNQNSGNLWIRNESKLNHINSGLRILKVQQHFLANRLELTVSYISDENHKNAFIAVDITNQQGVSIMQAIPTLDKFIIYSRESKDIVLEIELPDLIPNEYFTTIWIGSHNTETFEEIDFATSFFIYESPQKGRTFPHSENHGSIIPHSKLKHY